MYLYEMLYMLVCFTNECMSMCMCNLWVANKIGNFSIVISY